MASEISLLIPEFRKKINQLLLNCKARNANIEVLTTLISPFEQGSKWQQGRSKIDAELKSLALENTGAFFLAECIRSTQPQETNKCTNYLPGFSWFQWAEAVLFVWVDGCRKLNWSPVSYIGGFNGYQVLNEECKKLGLFNGDMVGMIQLREEPVDSIYTIQQINDEMEKRYKK